MLEQKFKIVYACTSYSYRFMKLEYLFLALPLRSIPYLQYMGLLQVKWLQSMLPCVRDYAVK